MVPKHHHLLTVPLNDPIKPAREILTYKWLILLKYFLYRAKSHLLFYSFVQTYEAGKVKLFLPFLFSG